jgi:hypothetical protein
MVLYRDLIKKVEMMLRILVYANNIYQFLYKNIKKDHSRKYFLLKDPAYDHFPGQVNENILYAKFLLYNLSFKSLYQSLIDITYNTVLDLI